MSVDDTWDVNSPSSRRGSSSNQLDRQVGTSLRASYSPVSSVFTDVLFFETETTKITVSAIDSVCANRLELFLVPQARKRGTRQNILLFPQKGGMSEGRETLEAFTSKRMLTTGGVRAAGT